MVMKAVLETQIEQKFLRINTALSSFPHCPRCLSYALYRLNNRGNYECLTCGLADIPEAIARRTQ